MDAAVGAEQEQREVGIGAGGAERDAQTSPGLLGQDESLARDEYGGGGRRHKGRRMWLRERLVLPLGERFDPVRVVDRGVPIGRRVGAERDVQVGEGGLAGLGVILGVVQQALKSGYAAGVQRFDRGRAITRSGGSDGAGGVLAEVQEAHGIRGRDTDPAPMALMACAALTGRLSEREAHRDVAHSGAATTAG